MILLLLRVLLHVNPALFQLRLLRTLFCLVWLLLGVPAVRAVAQPHKRLALPAQPAMMPRCCSPIADEFKPSYASVLVYGADPRRLEEAVDEAETKQRLASCFTAWCPKCYGPYLLTTGMDEFPSPSAHHTHQLVLLSVLRQSGALFPVERV
jgi:hypothetical protein